MFSTMFLKTHHPLNVVEVIFAIIILLLALTLVYGGIHRTGGGQKVHVDKDNLDGHDDGL